MQRSKKAASTPLAKKIAPSMTVTQAIRAFRDYQDSKGYTEATQESYKKVLVLIDRYLASRHQIVEVDQVGEPHLRQWLIDLRHEPGRYGERSSKTIQTYCRHMRPFFHWLYEQGYIETDPTDRIKLPKAKKTLIRIFEGDEVDRLQKACEPPAGRKATFLQRGLAARNRAILDLLLDTGIRRIEVCAVRIRDIDLKHETLYIQGKGQKERRLSLSPHVRHLISTYLNKWRSEPQSSDERIFLADDGRPLTVAGIEMIFRTLKKRASAMDKRISPHTCRHWFAVNFLRNGGSVFQLQELLGHEDLATVRIYVALSQQDALDQHRRYSPLEHRNATGKSDRKSGFRTPPTKK